MSPEKLAILRDRAHMLAAARRFFAERQVLEVDTCLMSPTACVDLHIDLYQTIGASEQSQYLHSSPEYAMKKLLAYGLGDIYQISHVFRDNEYSVNHYAEFMMVEWYRLNLTFEALIDETLAFIKTFIGEQRVVKINYRQLFIKYVGMDSAHATERELHDYLKSKRIDPYEAIEEEGIDGWLNLILSLIILPQLDLETLYVIQHYPASQAMLAEAVIEEGEKVAKRFEVFFGGLELANGYRELRNVKEQRQRLEEANKGRVAIGKQALPMDEEFLEALAHGLPECCGVSVGFDRLMMLRHDVQDIKEVLPVLST